MDKKQQNLLDNFFKDSSKWLPNQYLSKFLAITFFIISLLFYAFPVLRNDMEWMKENQDKIMIEYMFVLEWVAIGILMKKYEIFFYEKNAYGIGEILKYLPVSHKQLYIFKMRKAVGYGLKFAGIAAAVQLLSSLVVAPQFALLNVLIVIAGAFVVPILCMGVFYYFLR